MPANTFRATSVILWWKNKQNGTVANHGAVFSLSKNLNLCLAAAKMQGGARGGEARLELDQMPRKALRSKACGERSEDFRAAEQHKNLALFQAVKKVQTDFFDSLRTAPW